MLTDSHGAAVGVDRDDARSLFRILADGAEAGRTLFLDRPAAEGAGTAERVFFHTEVDEGFTGRGLATVLVREAVDATRAEGLVVVPVCPLVRRYLLEHESDYPGAFRRNTPADAQWVQQQLADR